MLRRVHSLLLVTLLATASQQGWAGPNVVPPRQRDGTLAAYPPDGKGDAQVVLVLLVDATGAVADVAVKEGSPPFTEAAIAAVRTWTFAPATRDGAPIAARISAVLTFHAPAPEPHEPATSAPGVAPASNSASTRAGAASTATRDEVVEVAVKGEHEELGTIHIPRAETRFVPGAFGDPFRVVEALPGMSPWVSGAPYFYVRGVSPENVGYFIDGVKIPILFHVGSGPSTIAPALVDSVDLFPAAYPARYGRYAGAVIAGETTPPDEERSHGDLQARVFDAAVFVETPFDEGRDTVLAAARYGYTGLITELIDPSFSLGYWDYQLRLSHRLAGGDHLSLFVFGSYDSLENLGSPVFHVEYHRADLRYDHRVRGGNLRLAATLSYDDALTALQTQTGAGAQAALKGPGARIRVEFDQRVSNDAWVRAGADLGETRFDLDQYTSTMHPPHTDVVGGGYADVVWRPTHTVEVVPGLRLDAYQARGETTLAPQPRLSAKVKIAPGLAWISAVGVAHQEPTDEVFVPEKLPDPIDEASRQSFQYSEALDVQLPQSLHLRATGFATVLRAAALGAVQRSGGVELFLRRDFTQRLGGFLSYTLSRSVTTMDRQTLRSDGDRTQVLSVVLGYDLDRGWRIGTRLLFESGTPYQQACQTPDCSPGETSKLYLVSGSVPPFYRVDFRIEKRWLFASGRWLAATIECFNATDNAQPTATTYTPQQGLVVSSSSAIVLPSVGVEAGF